MRRVRRKLLLAAAAVIAAAALISPFLLRRSQDFYTDGGRVREPAEDTRGSLRDLLWEPPEPLGDAINAPDLDSYEPRVGPDGDILIFTRGRPGENADLWASARKAGRWAEPAPLAGLNSPTDELAASFDATGDTILFSSDRPGGSGGFDIWEARRERPGGALRQDPQDPPERGPRTSRAGERREGDGFGEPRNLGPPVNGPSSELSPVLSADGLMLFFASDRREAAGGGTWRATIRATQRGANLSIYVARRATPGEPFGEPEALDVLNVPGSSQGTPALSPAGDFIYFASNRPGGRGGFDIYRARILGGAILPPENLGPQVNSSADELDPALTAGGFGLLFARSREGRETVFATSSREVFLVREDGGTYWSIAAVLAFLRSALAAIPAPILAFLLSLILFLLYAWLARRRIGGLSLLARAFIIALLVHLLVAIWMNGRRIQELVLQAFPQVDEYFPVSLEGPEESVGEAILEASAETGGDAPPVLDAAPPPIERAGPAAIEVATAPLDPARAEVIDGRPPDLPPEAPRPVRAEPEDLRAPEIPPPPEPESPPIAPKEDRAPVREAEGAEALLAVAPSAAPGPEREEVLAPPPARPAPASPADRFPEAAPPAPAPDIPRTPAGEPSVDPRLPEKTSGSIPEAPVARVASAAPPPEKPPESEALAGAMRAEVAPASREPSKGTLREEPPAPAPASDRPRSGIALAPPAGDVPRGVPAEEPAVEARIPARTPGEGEPGPVQVGASPVAPPAESAPEPEALAGGKMAEASAGPRAGVPNGDIIAAGPSAPAAAPERAGSGIAPRAPAGEILRAHGGAPAIEARSPERLAAAGEPSAPRLGAAPTSAPAEDEPRPESLASAPRAALDSRPPGAAASSPPEPASAPAARIAGSVGKPVQVAPDPGRARLPSLPEIPAAGPSSMAADPDPAPPAIAGPDVPRAPRRPEAESPAQSIDLAPRMPAVAVAPAVPLPSDPSPPAPTAAPAVEGSARGTGAGKAPREDLAGLVRPASLPGASGDRPRDLGGSPSAPSGFVPKIYALRERTQREEAVRTGGGGEATERAVERGLTWLAIHQSPDGRWSLHDFAAHFRNPARRDLVHPDWNGRGRSDSRGGSGNARSGDTGATGLALLAFLGHGDTHMEDGPHRETVERGLAWLLGHQGKDGDLRGGGNLYMHAIASFALCEAFAFTRDPRLREPAQRAIDFTAKSQSPQKGGWRYDPYPASSDVDTSVFGWMLMAAKSARLGGLDLDDRCLRLAAKYLDSARMTKTGGRYAYQPGNSRTSLAMTAQGFFAQALLADHFGDRSPWSAERLLRANEESTRILLGSLPRAADQDDTNYYYWYYATLALFRQGGAPWEAWNGALKDLLVRLQLGESEGTAAGSWDPIDRRSAAGGRVVSTALAILCLEVYYRYARPLER